MTQGLVLSFRESLEAVLIVGIILSTLKRQQQTHLAKTVILGAGTGALIAALGGILLGFGIQSLDEEILEIIEALMRLLASGLIAYFMIWLSAQNQSISESISASITASSTGLGLFILAFTGVFREGLELVILILANLKAGTGDLALGTLIGLVLALAIGWIVFKSSVKLNLNWIFKTLSLVLIGIGGQLLAEGLVGFFPSLETAESVITGLYIVVALTLYFRQDLQSIVKRQG